MRKSRTPKHHDDVAVPANRTRTSVRWAALLAVLLLPLTTVTSATAALPEESVVYSSTVSLGFIPSSTATTLPAFDRKLGALTSVEITADLDLSLEVEVLNRGPAATTRVKLAAEADLTGLGIPVPSPLGYQISESKTIGRDKDFAFNPTGHDQFVTMQTISDDDLSQFVGSTTDELDYAVAGEFLWSVTGPTAYQADGAAQATAKITIVYTYEPWEFDLDVVTTATASWDSDVDWTITKTADPASVALNDSQPGGLTKEVGYTIEVAPTTTDVMRVSGTMTVTNPNDYEITISDINNRVNRKEIPLDCPVDRTVAPGDKWVCNYSVEVDEPTGDSNVVAVSAGNTELGTSGLAQGVASFTFPKGPTYQDECIVVSDDQTELPSTPICVDDAIQPITYTTTFAIDDADNPDDDVIFFECGFDDAHANVASYTAADPGTETGQATASVAVTVACEDVPPA